jgi:pimeloyl-ACP methyl ester carboxylesterase
MLAIAEKELRAAMRDPRYTQSGHPESRAFRAWVGEGWRQLVAANEAGRGGGQRSQVRVRPYQRQRNGHAEQVCGYTQSRASGRGEAAHAPGHANDPQPAAPAAPANGNQPEKRVVIFVGGAGDKWLSDLVKDYGERFATDNPGVQKEYFTHDQADDIQRRIENLPPGTKVSVVGHSWGGNTAIQVVGRLAQENKRSIRW